ncbi:MAG: protein-L-isoaspartate(D-aspartate) O-methyltransferase [Elusimicrobia bacterium]|nr:protein-L-isoaspartate(D-aspartate) O-methyltransferase [Candidatus Liberimonas magnetica]
MKLIAYLSLILVLCSGVYSKEMDKENFIAARQAMVDLQIKKRGIKDPKVLKTLLTVERHKFIPQEYLYLADYDPYGDYPVPIGDGQTISQPYIVALMTELLNLKGGEKVLEIGTGSGYQAAVLSYLTKEVYTIEIIENLAQQAKERLKSYKNVFVKHGDGYLGWPEHAPFDRIIVTCAPDHIPEPLFEQLKENGRIIIPVGESVQELVLVRKKNGKMARQSVLPVRFVPMLRDK